MHLTRKSFSGLLACLGLFSSSFLPAQERVTPSEKKIPNNVKVEMYSAGSIVPLLPMLNEWSVREFVHSPYRYSPSKNQIVSPTDIILVNSRDSLIALAKRDGRVVGIISLIPFDAPELQRMQFGQLSVLEKIQASGFDPSKMIYAGYFLTAPDVHNDRQIVDALYQAMTNFALEKGKTQVCYMEDIGRLDPPNAENQSSIEPWGEVIKGFDSTGVQIGISWPTLEKDGSVKEMEHTLEFFVKDLESDKDLQKHDKKTVSNKN